MIRIGILQLTQMLDDAVEGFQEGLQALNVKAEFIYRNADGQPSRLPQLAAELAAADVSLIFACTTPSALAALALPAAIPVVYTPVFDPVGAGLAASLEQPGGNATGVSGMVAAAEKITFMRRLLPNLSRLGILFHTQDTNAQLEMKHFRQAASAAGLCCVEIPLEKAEDISSLPQLLPEDLDAIFLPIGKALEDNFASIVYYTDTLALPIVASHAPNVPAGALGALVADHRQLGKACAAKAAAILAGTPAGSIPVDIVKEPHVLLNSFAALNLGVDLAADLQAEAREIFE